MNNDEINLTPEQQKNLDTKIREKERVEDLNKELTEKAEKIKGKDYQNKKETYERDIRQIDEDIDNANKINERIRAKLDSYASATGSGEPQEIYRVFIPGGNELRLNYYQLNNIGKQMNVYFSRLDNPFLDSYNDTQREELARSILGTPVGTPIPTTPKATMTDNDKTDAN